MRGVRTLVIAYDFPPHAAIGTQRTLRFVRHLDEQGWPTAVLTGKASAYRSGTPVDNGLLERVPSQADVVRTGVLRPIDRLGAMLRPRAQHAPASPAKSGGSAGGAAAAAQPARKSRVRAIKQWVDMVASIPDSEVGWLLPAVFRGVQFARRWRPEVIYSSAPPWTGHLVAGAVALLTGRPWVADFRDPWARAPWRSARAHPLANRAAARFERWAVEHAAAVIFTTEAVHGDFAARYGEGCRAKSFVVPNGCDASMFDGVPSEEPESFVLLHAGSLYGGRDPQPLFRAIASAIASGKIDRARFRLRLLGAVALGDTDLRRSAAQMGLGDVIELLPRADHRASLQAMRSASALLLLQQGTTMSVPAKLYEYLAAGKRIFAICDEGETAALVRRSGVGAVAPAADAGALEAALVAFINARAGGAPRPDRALFDGAIGAARTAAIVEAAARSTVVALDVDATADRARSGA